ncbi:MAG: outer membrane lipoprotein-sorting protein [Marinicellaceae bacterium]
MKTILTVTTLFLISFLAHAQESSGLEIMQKSLKANYYSGLDRMTEGKMIITDKNNNIRVREFKVLRQNQETSDVKSDDQNYFVKFSHPNDLDGMVFMVKKQVESTDDRWLYLPKLDLVRRIAAGDKRTSFVGSDVLYEDVSGRHLNEDEHSFESETKNYYVIKSSPIEENSSEFSFYKTWVHKKTFLALKREYYDFNNNLYREIKVSKVKNIDDIPTIMSSTVKDLNTGSITQVSCTDVQYNVGVESGLFTERFLRNPPSQWFD